MSNETQSTNNQTITVMVRVIKNKDLMRLLAQEGLEDIILCKDSGCFFLTSDKDEIYNRLSQLDSTTIYVNTFNQLTPEQWLEEIKFTLQQCHN